MIRFLLVWPLVLLMACDGGDGPSDDADADVDDTDPTDTPPASDAPFFATGTYDGDDFVVECHFDGSDEDWTASLMCQEPYQFFITCRPSSDHGPVAGLEPSSFQVWFYLTADYGAPGAYDPAGMPGFCVGNNGGAPLCTNTENFLSGSITVDEVDLWTRAKGSFEGSWDGDDPWAGEHTATVSGSFDFGCD